MKLKYFEFSDEIKTAFDNHTPVLALESTVITHGMPYPQNLETALALEAIARDKGVTPATIAIVRGKIKIGLSEDELRLLAQEKTVLKVSQRDIPFVIANGLTAGTTVSATLFCANACDIKVFATGGIGGVHRGDDWDVSADLIELSRTPVAVVCAGAKAILDLPRTLEFLETHSIPVIGYCTRHLPAFYTDVTSLSVPAWADDVVSLAAMLKTQWELGMKSGALIVNPIAAEDSISSDYIDPIISSALETAAQQKISGKEVTPFLLKEVSEATQGKSQKANISLIKNNVSLGAELALAIFSKS